MEKREEDLGKVQEEEDEQNKEEEEGKVQGSRRKVNLGLDQERENRF